MLINLLIHILKILAKRPVLDQLGPVKTKTGLKTEKDRGLRSFAVRSSLFRFWDEGRLVSVSVHALRAKKPDWTRLSNTNYDGLALTNPDIQPTIGSIHCRPDLQSCKGGRATAMIYAKL